MQIVETAAKLQALGLSDKEAKVYVAALFLGPASVQKIAEQAEVNRATAYVILDQLADLGLMSQSTEHKKTVFVAEPPSALNRLFERQSEEIDRRRDELKELLPELEQTHRSDAEQAPVVRFYKGREGINAMLRELQRRARPNMVGYGFVNYDEVEKIVPDIFTSSPKRRLKKRRVSKIIYSYKGEVPSDPKLLRETIKVDQPIRADISLHEEVMALSTYAGKDSVGVIIDSKEIVAAFRQLFEMAWDSKQKKTVNED